MQIILFNFTVILGSGCSKNVVKLHITSYRKVEKLFSQHENKILIKPYFTFFNRLASFTFTVSAFFEDFLYFKEKINSGYQYYSTAILDHP